MRCFRPPDETRTHDYTSNRSIEADMVQLTLIEPDAAVVRTALESYLGDLRMEIADTDSQDFRDRLKQEEQILTRAVEQLRGQSKPGR